MRKRKRYCLVTGLVLFWMVSAMQERTGVARSDAGTGGRGTRHAVSLRSDGDGFQVSTNDRVLKHGTRPDGDGGPPPLNGNAKRTASLVQQGQYLTTAWNEWATLSDGDVALSFDRDGDDYLPPVRLLVPNTALERFAITYTVGDEALSITNIAPPGEADATFEISDTSGNDTFETTATYLRDPLRVVQRSSFLNDGRALELEISLTNEGSSPILDVTYFRAVNPDPDLDHYGEPATVDQVYYTNYGNLAVSSGPDSGLTLGLGVLDALAQVGFCYRCTSASYTPIDPQERLEDWDLEAVIPVGAIAPQYTVTFRVIYLAATSAEEAIAGWDEVRDLDGDGFSGLNGDCDDTRASVYPGSLEVCDKRDQDCNGIVDDGTECYDDDQDGFTELEGDCDDDNASVRPDAPEGSDTDGDGRPEGDGLDNDCDGTVDEGTDDFDNDGDGVSRQDGDCNDTDPTIAPNQDDIPYDGIDQNCDGTDLVDVDGDGYPGALADGTDCDDEDPDIHPEHDEMENGLDDDCDGLIDEPFVAAHDIVLTEILPDPGTVPDRQGEYLEVYNRSARSIALDGWTWSNAAGQKHTMDPGLGQTRLEPGDYLLLGINGDSAVNGGLALDYTYTNFTLANSSDRITLAMGTVEMSALEYGEGTDFPVEEGAALQLDPDCLEGPWDSSACWCAAPTAWASGSDRGSPGAANAPCPVDDDHDGWSSEETGGSDCDDADPTIYPGAPEDGGAGDNRADGVDNNCDGIIDEGTLDYDDDGDGFTELGGDCDDEEPAVYPGADELEDGLDNDCDGEVDPEQIDLDGDGFTVDEGDCDDTNPAVYPGSVPSAGEPFDPCPATGDPSSQDNDGDGYTPDQGDCDDDYASIYPGAEDVCGDGVDQDCDGTPDDGCGGGCGGCAIEGMAGAETTVRAAKEAETGTATQTGATRSGQMSWKLSLLWILGLAGATRLRKQGAKLSRRPSVGLPVASE